MIGKTTGFSSYYKLKIVCTTYTLNCLSLPVWHSTGQHLFRVVCLKLGEVKLNVTVGNGPSHTNPSPASAQATTRLSCAEPHSFKLQPRTDTGGECPLLQSSSRNIQVGGAVGVGPVRNGRGKCTRVGGVSGSGILSG